jgi:transcriptional regulator with XRE-family HTH domain
MYPNLKLELWRLGIRQNLLARQLSIDETLLSRVLNGYRHPSPEMRSRIAAFLQCDEQWLFEREERKQDGGLPLRRFQG